MTSHLLLGQVDDAAAPVAVAAELYLWSASFGNSAGTDVPALIETDDSAPAGPGGLFVGRRVYLPLRYSDACTVKVTPIVDFNQSLPATTQSFTTPAAPHNATITVLLAKTLTYIRVKIEVTARAGVVEFYQPSIAGKTLTGAYSAVAEAQG